MGRHLDRLQSEISNALCQRRLQIFVSGGNPLNECTLGFRVTSGSRVLLACGQSIETDESFLDFQDQQARPDRMAARDIFSRGQDQAARWFGFAQSCHRIHASPTRTVSSGAEHPIRRGVISTDICRAPLRREVIDYDQGVLRVKGESFNRIGGRRPGRRQMLAAHRCAKVLLLECCQLALESACFTN